MKVVFSRKGFDSTAGGKPSPILPDGSLLSLPIPQGDSSITYSDLSFNGHNLGKIVSELTGNRIYAQAHAHLDPDIIASIYPREPGWRPIFGQESAAQSHLSNHGIGPGDLFLFFGWFRAVEVIAGQYRFVPGAPDIHAIFGWLQVGEIIHVDEGTVVPGWAAYHPHVSVWYSSNNTLYTASDSLSVEERELGMPGGGAFPNYKERLCLSAEGRSRSTWKLPHWFYPTGGKEALSYHSDLKRWEKKDDHVLLRSAARGQEFVLDTKHYPEAIEWVGQLLQSAG